MPARWCCASGCPIDQGALGQVASRIGSVHGDLLAIDILERGGGQVVDELVILVPSATSDELLVREVRAVDGVAVEDLRVVDADRRDPAMAMSEVGAAVAEAAPADAVEILCCRAAPRARSRLGGGHRLGGGTAPSSGRPAPHRTPPGCRRSSTAAATSRPNGGGGDGGSG